MVKLKATYTVVFDTHDLNVTAEGDDEFTKFLSVFTEALFEDLQPPQAVGAEDHERIYFTFIDYDAASLCARIVKGVSERRLRSGSKSPYDLKRWIKERRASELDRGEDEELPEIPF